MAKVLSTKFTGALSGYYERRKDCWDAEDYLERICSARRSVEIADYLKPDALEHIQKGLDKAASKIKNILYVSLVSVKEGVYEITIETEGSQPATVKKAFKELGGSQSNLDGLRGNKRRRSGNAYEYAIEVNCNDSDGITPGILRLVRLYEGLKLATQND